MYAKPFILTLLITSVFGNKLHIHKRDDCDDCTNAAFYTDSCTDASNSVECLCSNDKFWSVYEDCVRCLDEPLTSVTALRSEYCAIATNPYYTADYSDYSDYYGNDFTNDIYPNYSYDSSITLEMASSTMDLVSSDMSSAMISSAMTSVPVSSAMSSTTISSTSKDSTTSGSQGSSISSKDQTKKSSSSSKGSSSSEGSSSSKASGSLESKSSSDSSTSSGDGNILLASKMSVSSLLVYVLFML